ncbi:hypothetical protein A2Z22_02790 [Candidatus Woesebacteria bacterium RBG_16_34_12]|uniref:Uncharacterized protein n=1 Tax=Candidatus Woesebacteria bacterium RBG_16_34_12 TaxID=1802480 RepID=A0A1F7X8T5_9BACT|nr:MAG: hypothetical protein A2Z22_02790 [Candidatus Woesebacteria bacterium RBG_16_34_12]
MDILKFLGVPVDLVLKTAILIALAIYLVFGYVILKQVRLMNETLEIGFENAIKIVAYIHFILILITFFLAIFIL